MSQHPSRIQQTFFNFDGRLNRLAFFIYSLVLSFIAIIIGIIYFAIFGFFNSTGMANLLLFIINLVLWISNLSLDVRRLHDLNLSGWWYLLMIVPFINIIFLLVMLFKKGTDGDNKYGSDPLQE